MIERGRRFYLFAPPLRTVCCSAAAITKRFLNLLEQIKTPNYFSVRSVDCLVGALSVHGRFCAGQIINRKQPVDPVRRRSIGGQRKTIVLSLSLCSSRPVCQKLDTDQIKYRPNKVVYSEYNKVNIYFWQYFVP